jgi:hypothetical protein
MSLLIIAVGGLFQLWRGKSPVILVITNFAEKSGYEHSGIDV